MTNSPETFERPVIRSSVTPSLKYSCDGSWLRFVNGKTATDGLSGRASPADSGVFSQRQLAQPAAPRSNVTATAAATPLANRARVLPALGDASGRRTWLETEAVHANRSRDVLDGVLAFEFVAVRKLSLDLVVRCAREADAAALGQTFQTSGDVDAVSVEPLALDDDVPEIDPDAEPHPARGWQRGVPRLEFALDVDRALNGVDDAP